MCRVFKKKVATVVRKVGDHQYYDQSHTHCWFDEQVSFMQELESSPRRVSHPYNIASYNSYPRNQLELEVLQYNNNNIPHPHVDAANFLQLPQLESPRVPQSAACSPVVPYGYEYHSNSNSNNNNKGISALQSSTLTQEELQIQVQQHCQQLLYGGGINDEAVVEQVRDWRVLDKFVASQFSQIGQEDASKESSYSNVAEQLALLANDESKKQEIGHQEYASTSNSSCQLDPWK